MSKNKILIAALSLLLAVCCLSSCSFGIGNIVGSIIAGKDPGFSENPPKLDYSKNDCIEALLDEFSYYDFALDDDDLAKALVYAYANKTGDRYAYYYTPDEFDALNAESQGENQGVGITVIENTEYKCIEIISVLPDTPASNAGVMAGDLIVAVGSEGSHEDCSAMGYEQALKKLQGVKGTYCDFGVVRDGDFDNVIFFHILRETFIAESVMYSVSKSVSQVGIVKILQFDLTTPTQFKEAMNALIAEGCDKFVYDVRNNPGGDLASISAVLSYFLSEGDTVIITEDRKGNVETDTCEAKNYAPSSPYYGCSVKKSEIGMYRKYPCALLTNGHTASAAELFTGTFKAYGISTVIVGETTYGKGCMQSIFDLKQFGFSGAVKLTTKFYRPYNTDNYDGIGITPDVELALGEEASKINIFKLLTPECQYLDNQLDEALKALRSLNK